MVCMNTLTSKQQRVLSVIKEFQRAYNRMPTRQELADKLGYKSANSIQQYLSVLQEKGYLDLEKNKTGGISIENQPTLADIPLLGMVACGTPIFAEENVEAYIQTDHETVRNRPKDFFYLTAHGDSMNAAGIDDGDLLLIENKPNANSGDIVLALLGDDATVKVYKPNTDYVALVPKSRNPIHKPIILTSNFLIQGIICKVIKTEGLDS